MKIKSKIIITLLLVFTSSVAMAHEGKIDADGCHRGVDDWHCHSAGKTDAINGTDSINGTSLRKERGKGFSFETFVGFDWLGLKTGEVEADYSVDEDEFGYTTSFGLSLEYHIDETHSVGIDYYEFNKISFLELPISTSEGTFNSELTALLSHKVVGPTYRYYFPFGLYLGISYFTIDTEVVLGSFILPVSGVRVPSVSATERNNQFSPSIGYKHVFKNGFILGSRFIYIPTIIEGTDSDVSSLGFTMGYDFR